MISAESELKKKTRDMEQTRCLSRESQVSSFTIRKISREQEREKYTHPKVDIMSRFSRIRSILENLNPDLATLSQAESCQQSN